jgi:hypothetical protein
MLTRSRLGWLSGLVLLVGFVLGMYHLLRLRFERGDVYPPYSSLRADPLGTRALLESLQRLPGLHAGRFFQETQKLGEGRGTTLLVLGLSPGTHLGTTEDEAKELERFMSKGGRLVLSFRPVNSRPLAQLLQDRDQLRPSPESKSGRKRGDEAGPPGRGKKRSAPKRKSGETPLMGHPVDLDERWQFALAYQGLPRDDQGGNVPVRVERAADDAGLPADLTWHTALYFDKLGPDWRTLYVRGKLPGVVERPFGAGSLVLAADSYFLSNEALRVERQSTLLAWVVGRASRVLFDETHLGVQQDPGIAVLIRKYRLHGLVVSFLLLALLFVWRNAVSFVPPYEETAALLPADVVAGRDSAAGFVNLLRRNIRPRDVLQVCFQEWKRSCAHGRADLQGRASALEALLRQEASRKPAEQDAPRTYQAMCRALQAPAPDA